MRTAVLIMVLLAAIAGLGPALAHEERLAGGDWVLAGVSGAEGPALRFEAGRVSGTGGCNRFGGRYEERGDRLIFSPLAATRMACAPDVMRQEQAFFAMLKKVRRLDIKNGTLTLMDDTGAPLASFMRRGG
jgi:heat shock protein HslJ